MAHFTRSESMAEEGAQDEAPSSNLLTLPDELLGQLYSMLDPPSRHSFFSVARELRWSQSILSRVQRLVIRAPSGRTVPPSQLPVLHFPSGCSLTSLTIQGGQHIMTEEGIHVSYRDNLLDLMSMLQPEGVHSGVLQEVETITLQGLHETDNLLSPYPGHTEYVFGNLLASLPSLHALRLCGMREFDTLRAEFFQGLAAQQSSSLNSLWITNCDMDATHLRNICLLSSLRVLSVDAVFQDDYDLGTQIPFSALSQLECLAIHGTVGPHTCEAVYDTQTEVYEKILSDLGAALPQMPGLKRLTLPCAPPARLLTALLPSSVENLALGCIVEQDSPGLHALLAAISSEQFPGLIRFRVRSLHVCEGLESVDPLAVAPKLRGALDRGFELDEGYRLHSLAVDLLACASVCPDVGIEGICTITHHSDTQVINLLKTVGLPISSTLRSVSLAVRSQLLHDFISPLREYVPNVSEIIFHHWEPEFVLGILATMPRLELVSLHMHLQLHEKEFSPTFKEDFLNFCSCASSIRSAFLQHHLTIHLDVLAEDHVKSGLYPYGQDKVKDSTNKLWHEARGPRGVLSGALNVSVTRSVAFVDPLADELEEDDEDYYYIG